MYIFNKHITLLLLMLLGNILSFSQRGKDGVKLVSNTQVVNEYTYLTTSALSGANSLTVQQSGLNINGRFANSIAEGDLLLIINVQGATINGTIDPGDPNAGLPIDNSWGDILDYKNVGLFEYVEVESAPSGSQINLMCTLLFDHTVSATEKVLVVRVPRYESLTVNPGGEITCDNWNGQIGGVVAIEVNGMTTVDGDIDVSEKGFRGGELNANSGAFAFRYAGNSGDFGGEKGESIAGYKNDYNPHGGAFGRGAPANGGGAGNAHNGGGAGGANAGQTGIVWTGKGVPSSTVAAWNNAWNLEQAGLAGSRSSGGGKGGYCFSADPGDALTQAPGDAIWGGHNRQPYGGDGGRPLDYSAGRIYFGGGGGSGHQNDGDGGKGGNAGGMILIQSYGDVTGTGRFLANGQDGDGSEGSNPPFNNQSNEDGSGGGGAGGTILIQSAGIITTSGAVSEILARGGNGGNQVLEAGVFGGSIDQAQGPGGGGGGGFIALSNPVGFGVVSDVAGGSNGVTNSPSLSEFPPNGATFGDSGLFETIPPLYNITAVNDTICGGGSVTLTPIISGVLPVLGGQLQWFTNYSDKVPFYTGNSYVTPVLNATTTYYIGGCGIPFKDSVQVVVSSLVIIDETGLTVQDESCAGNDGQITGLTISGGIGTLNYTWNNSPTQNIDTFNLSGGTYTFIATDSLGCADTSSSITVAGTQVPSFNTTFMSLVADSCDKGTGEVNGLIAGGGSGSYLYEVDGNVVPSLNVNGLDSGNHLMVVIDNVSGCSDSLTVNIPVVLGPTLNFGNDTTLCNSQTVTLDMTTAGANYEWQDGSTNPTFTVNTAGLYWGEANVNGCTARDSIVVSYTTGTPIALGNDTSLCQGESLLLDVTVAGATYLWQDASTNATFNVTSAGQYHVRVDEAGCINRDTINVTYQTINVDIGNDTALCDMATLPLDATNAGASYLWQDGSTNATYTVSAGGPIFVDVTLGNCTVRDSIFVSYGVSPIVNLGNDTILCNQANLLLDANIWGAMTYEWQDGSTNSTFNVTTDGTYFVEATDGSCSGFDTINVSYQTLDLALGNDTVLCDNNTLQLDATGIGLTYLWSDNSTQPMFTVNSSGLYWGEISDGNCIDRDSINVAYNQSPTVNLGNDTTICLEEETITLDVSAPDVLYSWDDGSTAQTRFIELEGEYFVRLTNFCGVDSDTINVLGRDCSCNVFIPNAFSPNGDGFNDRLKVETGCDFDLYQFRVYNRKGRLTHFSVDPNEFWNGEHKGKLNESEVYVYRLKYRVVGQIEIQVKEGHITMLR